MDEGLVYISIGAAAAAAVAIAAIVGFEGLALCLSNTTCKTMVASIDLALTTQSCANADIVSCGSLGLGKGFGRAEIVGAKIPQGVSKGSSTAGKVVNGTDNTALPNGYREFNSSAGAAANKTGGLPDGYRRVISPDGDIHYAAPNGTIYKSIDDIPLPHAHPNIDLPPNYKVSKLSELSDPALDLNKIRNATNKYLKESYKDEPVSYAIASVTKNGKIEYFLATSGKSWSGASKTQVEIDNIVYKVITVDSESIPSVANGLNQTNRNHAEQKIFSYLTDTHMGQKVDIKMAIQNTNSEKAGMCLGCNLNSQEFAKANPTFNINIYHGATGQNP